MNRYFIIPELKIDKELIDLPSKKYKEIEESSYGGFGHKLQNYTFPPGSKIPELSNLYKQFKNKDVLGQSTILKIAPGESVLPHVDAYRKAAINIPISNNWNECYTGFYSACGWRKLVFLPNFLLTKNNIRRTPGGAYPCAKLEEKLVYSNAVCLNIQEIHGVVNSSDKPRYVLSISIKPQYTFNDIKNLYNSGNLI
jgi:hypothetical protein